MLVVWPPHKCRVRDRVRLKCYVAYRKLARRPVCRLRETFGNRVFAEFFIFYREGKATVRVRVRALLVVWPPLTYVEFSLGLGLGFRV